MFTDAPQAQIERLLTEPGADVVTVTTAESGYEPARNRATLRMKAAGTVVPLRLPLSEERMRAAWASVRGGDAGSLAACVEVAGEFIRSLFPGGLRLAGSADDTAAGLGAVAGFRARLVAGPGWARVGSWDGLEEAVAAAGPGASALVLASFAGGRQGHAVVLHGTSEGLRWADPAGGVTAERPGAAGHAVAAWAVVVGSDGWVAAPGGWSARESAGGAEVLVDAPLRHDFGAMGVEIERHNVRIVLPTGRPVKGKTWLLRSHDGLVNVVADSALVWVGEDLSLYESRAAMQAAGESGHPQLNRMGEAGAITVSIPEAVTAPWRVLDEQGRPDIDQVIRRVGDLDRYWKRAPEDLQYSALDWREPG